MEQVQAVAEYSDHQRADNRPADRPDPAVETRTAQHRRSDGVRFISVACRRLARIHPGCKHDARKRERIPEII